jgi:hypothetical protein
MLDGYHHIVISTDTSSCYHREMSTNTHALNTADAMLSSTDTQSSCYHHLVISTIAPPFGGSMVGKWWDKWKDTPKRLSGK